MAADNIVKLVALFFITVHSLSAHEFGRPYLVLAEEGEPLPSNSYINIAQYINTDGIECRARGARIRKDYEEDDERSGPPSVRGYWIGPNNKVVVNMQSIDVRYRREALFLEFEGLAVAEGLYRCVSEVPHEGQSTTEAVIVGLYLSGGECTQLSCNTFTAILSKIHTKDVNAKLKHTFEMYTLSQV